MKFNNSLSAFEEAYKVIPGGVDSPVRAFKSVGGTPPFIAKGEGGYIFDIDGLSKHPRNRSYYSFWIFNHIIRIMYAIEKLGI